MTYPPVTAIQVARTQAEKLLRDTATHYIKTDTTSASGATTKAWAAQGTTLPCLVFLSTAGKSVHSEVSEVAGTVADVSSHTIRFAYGAGVKVGDRVVIGSSTFAIVSDGDSDTNRLLLIVGANRVREGKLT